MPQRAKLKAMIQQRGFETDSQTAYVLDGANRIVYCNPAWDTFALANHGPNAAREKVLGIDVLSVCCKALYPFYSQLLSQCRSSQKSICHGYNCSSPDRLRVFEMKLEPAGDFIFIRNRLLQESSHSGPALRFDPVYIQHGLLTLCANCRRTRNWESGSWDWIPELLASDSQSGLSHGICEHCSEFYYGIELTHHVQRLQSKQ